MSWKQLEEKYTQGGIGYFSANGEFDTCIALRTAVAKNKKILCSSWSRNCSRQQTN
jgi:anthranilate/para-aminobenzoate synthase component I